MKPRTLSELKALPRPRNTAELEALTLWYFGKALHIGKLFVSGNMVSYDIAEAYNEYHGDGWLFAKHDTNGYDYSAEFWKRVFGVLTSGGIARNSYGQSTIGGGYRERLRLEQLQDSWARKDAGRVRKSLARLAPNGGGGENTAILGSGRVPTLGREDGARAVSRGEAIQ